MSQLDDSYRNSVKKHNEEVDKNRHVLNRIIDCIKFCGVHELALGGRNECEQSNNRGVLLDIIDHTAQIDSNITVEDFLRNGMTQGKSNSLAVLSTSVVQWLSYSPLDPRFAGWIPAGVDGFLRA